MLTFYGPANEEINGKSQSLKTDFSFVRNDMDSDMLSKSSQRRIYPRS